MHKKFTTEEAGALLEKIVKGFISYPENLKVEARAMSDDSTIGIKFWTHRSDAGKAIGKEGKNIRALKAMFAALGASDKVAVHVMMDEPYWGDPDAANPAPREWDGVAVAKLLVEVLDWMSPFPYDLIEEKSGNFINYIVTFDVPDGIPKEARLALGIIFCAIGKSHGQKCDVVTN